jgi:hypothetical protein
MGLVLFSKKLPPERRVTAEGNSAEELVPRAGWAFMSMVPQKERAGIQFRDTPFNCFYPWAALRRTEREAFGIYFCLLSMPQSTRMFPELSQVETGRGGYRWMAAR